MFAHFFRIRIAGAGHLDYQTIDPDHYNACILDFLDTFVGEAAKD